MHVGAFALKDGLLFTVTLFVFCIFVFLYLAALSGEELNSKPYFKVSRLYE